MDDDTDSEYGDAETDWLANCRQGYGFGFTEDGALRTLAGYGDTIDNEIMVSLVEHVGDATVSMTGWEVETFVSGKEVTIPADQWNALVDAAIDSHVAAEAALGAAEQDCTFEKSDTGLVNRVE
jgi:hypothetical protein